MLAVLLLLSCPLKSEPNSTNNKVLFWGTYCGHHEAASRTKVHQNFARKHCQSLENFGKSLWKKQGLSQWTIITELIRGWGPICYMTAETKMLIPLKCWILPQQPRWCAETEQPVQSTQAYSFQESSQVRWAKKWLHTYCLSVFGEKLLEIVVKEVEGNEVMRKK